MFRLVLLIGLSTLFVALIMATGLLLPSLAPITDLLLIPGEVLPVAYWGGLHDPLQLLAATLLDIAFYAGLMYGVFYW